MKKITNAAELKQQILELEATKEYQHADLKQHFAQVREAFRPANLIKSTVRDVTSTPGIGGKLAGTLVGLLAGYLTKRVVFGSTHNPLKKMAGTLLQMGIAGTIGKNADGLKALGANLVSRVLKRSRNNVHKEDVSDRIEQY